jgi:hypothetical protein
MWNQEIGWLWFTEGVGADYPLQFDYSSVYFVFPY